MARSFEQIRVFKQCIWKLEAYLQPYESQMIPRNLCFLISLILNYS